MSSMNVKIENFILKHLKSLKIKKNDNILVYSDLSRFGFSSKALPKIIISCLKSILGKNGTIIMPFYNFRSDKKFIFDKKKFIYTSMEGVLVREFCKEKKITRSDVIIHNHIGLGPQAKVLNLSKEQFSIGKNSDFEFLENYNFKLLMLACDATQGATFLHHIEALYGVPYRKWVFLKKKKITNGVKKTIRIKYYQRRKTNYLSNFKPLFEKILMIKPVICEQQKVKYGRSYLISLRNLHKIALKFLKKNKFCFVKKIN
jgi:aminoglycoside N3'-acetyltransferase